MAIDVEEVGTHDFSSSHGWMSLLWQWEWRVSQFHAHVFGGRIKVMTIRFISGNNPWKEIVPHFMVMHKVFHGNTHAITLLLLCQMFRNTLRTNLYVLQSLMQNYGNTSFVHRHFIPFLKSDDLLIISHDTVQSCNCFLSDNHMLLTWSCLVFRIASSC